ncbi:hypothetical protein MRX96_040676 [Rhipicephalus microplus]
MAFWESWTGCTARTQHSDGAKPTRGTGSCCRPGLSTSCIRTQEANAIYPPKGEQRRSRMADGEAGVRFSFFFVICSFVIPLFVVWDRLEDLSVWVDCDATIKLAL